MAATGRYYEEAKSPFMESDLYRAVLFTFSRLTLLALTGLTLLGTLAALIVWIPARLALASLIALTLTALALLHALALLTGLILLTRLALLSRTLIAVISHGNFLEFG